MSNLKNSEKPVRVDSIHRSLDLPRKAAEEITQTCIGKAFWRNGHCYVFESWSVETIVTAKIPTPNGIKFVIDEDRLRCGITIGVWDKMPEGAYIQSDPFYEFLSKDDGYVPIQLQEGYDDDYQK